MTTDGPASDGGEPPAPVLRVVRGDPDERELAALLAVLTSRPSGQRPIETERPSTWAVYWRGLRQPVRHGPDGWRGSALPR